MLTYTAPVLSDRTSESCRTLMKRPEEWTVINIKCHQTSPSLIWGQLRIIEVKASASTTTKHPFYLNLVSHLINNYIKSNTKWFVWETLNVSDSAVFVGAQWFTFTEKYWILTQLYVIDGKTEFSLDSLMNRFVVFKWINFRLKH